jgi:uncharacterized integral membrane protein
VSTPQPPAIPEPSPAAAPPVSEPKPEKEKQPSTWQPLLYLKLVVLLFVIGYSIAFAVENSRQINIDFIFATAKVRLIWEILLLLAIGILGGILISQLYRHRRRAQIAKKSGKARHSRSDVGD